MYKSEFSKLFSLLPRNGLFEAYFLIKWEKTFKEKQFRSFEPSQMVISLATGLNSVGR